MSNKVTLTQEELENHLSKQLQFLQNSSESYDNGFDSEAKRLAVTIRVLLYDTQKSHSLLGQLGRLCGQFITTAILHDPRNVGTHGGLVYVAAKGKESEYCAMLDDVPYKGFRSKTGGINPCLLTVKGKY